MSVTIREVIEEKLKTAKSILAHYSKNTAINIIMKHTEHIMQRDVEIKFLEHVLTLMDKYGDKIGANKSIDGHRKNLTQNVMRSTDRMANFYDYVELTTQIRLINEFEPHLDKNKQ